MLRTDILEKLTLDLLRKLQRLSVFDDLRLVGGTALALQFGHRHSVDLDFFGNKMIDSTKLLEVFEQNELVAIQVYDSKNIKQFTIDGVKVDIVNYPYEWLEPILNLDNIRMANLADIVAMKLEAITNRGTKKDFIDIYFLLQHFSLPQMLSLYLKKYSHGSSFNVIRSLTYFADAESDPMPRMFIPVNWKDIKLTICSAVENVE